MNAMTMQDARDYWREQARQNAAAKDAAIASSNAMRLLLIEIANQTNDHTTIEAIAAVLKL